jgi:hypothetical protein
MDREQTIARLKGCLQGLAPLAVPFEKGIKWRASRPRFTYPNLLRFALCDLLGFPYDWEPVDKVRWSIDASYEGLPVVLEDRKLGLYLGVPESMSVASEQKLIKRLLGATRIAAVHVRTLAEPQVEAGNFTLSNTYWWHDERYRYFRTRAQEAYSAAAMGEDSFRSKREGDHNLAAMLNEFFSRLEHLMILLLPARLDFDPRNGQLKRLMSAGWKAKFKAIFDIEADADAKRLFNRLEALKESFRNPQAHGGFLKQGGSAWFHMKGVGALPMDLLDREFEGWLESSSPSFEEICQLCDDVDTYVRSHRITGLGMIAVEGHVDPAFDEDSLRDYREFLQRALMTGDREVFSAYVDGLMQRRDAHDNYEF